MSASSRLLVVGTLVLILVLEGCCRLGFIPAFSMIPPSRMAVGLWGLLSSGTILPDMKSTLVSVVVAAVAAITSGFVLGAAIQGTPRLRETLDPFLASYYSTPIWVFYPLFVFVFGLTDVPKVIIGYLYAVIAMIANTLNGLDRVPRVLRKTAQVFGMGRTETLLRIILPTAVPYVFTGIKLAISYAFTGVVVSEFILATSGLGYRISWAYVSFDNNLLYSTILLIVIFSVIINMSLSYWERRLMLRRGVA
jgi:NitT/TauT family transport system permease protein